MHVEAINIGPSDALGPVSSVLAVAGQGLEGDRYFAADAAGPGEVSSAGMTLTYTEGAAP